MNDEDTHLYITALLGPALDDYAGHDLVPRDAALPPLKSCLRILEQEMSSICTRYSKLRLLMLIRTLCPPWVFTGHSPHPTLAINPHRVLTAVVLKHGGSVIEGSLMGPLYGSFPITEQEREDCGRLSLLAQYYSHVEKVWYAYGHGASIAVREGGIDIVWIEEQAILARIENGRIDQNVNSLLAPSAMLCEVDYRKMPSYSEPYVLLAQPVVRLEGDADPEPPSVGVPVLHGGQPFRPYHLPVMYGMRKVESLLHLYRSDFTSAYGLAPNEYLALLSALSWLQVDGNVKQPEFFADFCRTGLGLFQRQPTLEFLTRCYEQCMPVIATASPREKVRRFSETVVLSGHRFRRIDLHGHWVPYLLYEFGDLYVADWSNIPLMLNALLTPVSQSAAAKNTRGSRLEHDLANWISASGINPQPLFRPNQKLRLRGRVAGEVDLSYVAGRVAYIVECKAYAASRYYYRGDPDAVNTRWQHSERWLSQVIRTAQFLAENPTGDNYKLPDDVRYIVPLVCSLNVEPVSVLDDMHFVSSDMPRICTPSELLALLRMDLDPAVTPNGYTFTRNP